MIELCFQSIIEYYKVHLEVAYYFTILFNKTIFKYTKEKNTMNETNEKFSTVLKCKQWISFINMAYSLLIYIICNLFIINTM